MLDSERKFLRNFSSCCSSPISCSFVLLSFFALRQRFSLSRVKPRIKSNHRRTRESLELCVYIRRRFFLQTSQSLLCFFVFSWLFLCIYFLALIRPHFSKILKDSISFEATVKRTTEELLRKLIAWKPLRGKLLENWRERKVFKMLHLHDNRFHAVLHLKVIFISKLDKEKGRIFVSSPKTDKKQTLFLSSSFVLLHHKRRSIWAFNIFVQHKKVFLFWSRKLSIIWVWNGSRNMTRNQLETT